MPLSNLCPEDFSRINEFMGSITKDQLRYVDCFVAQHICLLLPIAGACELAAFPMHKHPAYSFILSFSDTTTVVISDTKHRTQPNTIYFLSPNIPHHEICEVGIPRYIGVFISPAFLQKQSLSYKQYNLSLEKTTIFKSTDELLLVIKRFIIECKQHKPGSEILLEALSIEIAHALIRSMLNLHDKDCADVSRIEINRSIEYMRQNISEKLTLPLLSGFAGMSVSNFTRTFWQETGLSPID